VSEVPVEVVATEVVVEAEAVVEAPAEVATTDVVVEAEATEAPKAE
jgi:hypothetical protein